MRVVFLDVDTITLGDIDFSGLAGLGDYEGFGNTLEGQVVERACGAEAVVVNKVPMTAGVLEGLAGLKLVSVIATGVNNVDLAAARRLGVTVCNVAGYAAGTVPQHTFALILNLATRAYRYHGDIMAGAWQAADSFTLLRYPTFELAGKTIGIIGFGVIGRGVAQIAEAFGMRVLAHDAMGFEDERYVNTELDELLRESDVVTVHCPLTEASRGLIDERALGLMKRTAMVINTARGGIVDEKALAAALNSDRIAGAGVDVLTVEPPREGNVLLEAKNVILTPHSAWSTVEARQRLVDGTVENIRAFWAGRPRNVVT